MTPKHLIVALACAGIVTTALAADAPPEAFSWHGHVFVPGKTSSTPELPEALRRTLTEGAGDGVGAASHHLVGTSGRAAEARDVLEGAGLRLLWPLRPAGDGGPTRAWVVRAPAGGLPESPAVSWSLALGPVHVPSAGLRAALLADAPSWPTGPSGRVRLALRLFPGADVAAARDLADQAPATAVRAVDSVEGTLLLSVEPTRIVDAVAALARIPDAMLLDLDPMPRPELDDVAVSLQTGLLDAPSYDESAVLFRKGLTGRGLIVAVADSDLPRRHVQVTYSADPLEECPPTTPAPLSTDPVPQELPLDASDPPARSRERKVVAYAVADGAEAGDGDGHGFWVSAAAVGDDNEALAARPLARDLGVDQNLPGWPTPAPWRTDDELRADLADRVDDPTVNDPDLPTAFGDLVQHHQGLDGVAPGAQLFFQDIGHEFGLTGDYTTRSLLQQAHGVGATVFNASFGSGACRECYERRAAGADDATWILRDLVVVTSAGNEGFDGQGTITRGFAHARNALAVGGSATPRDPSEAPATRPGEDLLGFTSRGPRSGGMFGPDFVAPGWVWVRTADGTDVEVVVGTSFSSAATSGAAALVQQYFRDGYYPSGTPTAEHRLRPTSALVKALFVNSTRSLRGSDTGDERGESGPRPSLGQGFGLPVLDESLYFEGDPTADDPRGDLERAGLLVLNDTPNGLDLDACGGCGLAAEPGGFRRDEIVADFRPAIADGEVHDFLFEVINPTPGDPAFELRVTLAWAGPGGVAGGSPHVNDLDLEVVSPGPDGILQSVPGELRGDDVVYRPSVETAWSGGLTQPSSDARLQSSAPPFLDVADADDRNVVENVFVASVDATAGVWMARVVGRDVPGEGRDLPGRPNMVDGDMSPVLDTDGDGTPDAEIEDLVHGDRQGYALIVSGGVSGEVPPCAALEFPSTVDVTPQGDCALLVDWDAARGGRGAITYDVHRAAASPVPLAPSTLVASGLTATEWLDPAPWGTAWTYRVVARDSCLRPGPQELANEAGDSVAVEPIDETPPDFAGIEDTRDLGHCEVEVTWDESTAIDPCSGVSGYDIFRDRGVAHAGETLVAENVPGSPYIDTTPGNGTWVYVVRARDAAGNVDDNTVFQQESEGSCTNDFPRDAGLDREDNVDPPNADGGDGIRPTAGDSEIEIDLERLGGASRTEDATDLRIRWKPSPDEGGLYPITYSVLRGRLDALHSGYSHELVSPDSCGLTERRHVMPDQVDGSAWYYIVVPVSGANATFGYDHEGVERPEAFVCE